LLLEYPSKLLNTTLQCVFASVQSLAIALVLERDFSRWKLAGPVSLASVLFTVTKHATPYHWPSLWPSKSLLILRCACCSLLLQGIVVAAISYYLQIWVIEKKGPVFLSMSMPLSLVFTMAIASFLLGEDVSLGRYVMVLVTSHTSHRSHSHRLPATHTAPAMENHQLTTAF